MVRNLGNIIGFLNDVGEYEGFHYLKFVELSLSSRFEDKVFRSIVDLEKAVIAKASDHEIEKFLVSSTNIIQDSH